MADPSGRVPNSPGTSMLGQSADNRVYKKTYQKTLARREKNIELMHLFVPDLVLRHELSRIASLSSHEKENVEFAPTLERCYGAVVFADVSGFSSLAEHLHHGGGAGTSAPRVDKKSLSVRAAEETSQQGAELLHQVLNAYFGAIMRRLCDFGGDVIKLAGDACFAIWRCDDEKGLALAAHAATHAIFTAVQELHNYECDGFYLSLHAGVGIGEVHNWFIGSNVRKFHVATGAPVEQSTAACDTAKPGEVIVSPEVWKHLVILNSAYMKHLVGKLCDYNQREIRSIPGRPPPKFQWMLEQLGNDLGEKQSGLSPYVPSPVMNYIVDVHRADLALLRRLTILFLSLDISYKQFTTDGEVLEALQRSVSIMQRVIGDLEGYIKEFGVDDKGTILVAGFGVPPHAHTDDAVRGITAALTMEAELRKLGYSCAIGVTTGETFCGTIGNEVRSEFALIGAVVNLAARLMVANLKQVKAEGPLILCDTETHDACGKRIKFTSHGEITVKGKKEPVAIHRPIEIVRKTRRDAQDEQRMAIKFQETEPLIGRDSEIEHFKKCLDSMEAGKEGQGILLLGNHGVGKTKLAFELRRLSHQRNIAQTKIRCKPNSTPFLRPFGELLDDILGISKKKTAREKRNALVGLVGDKLGISANKGAALLAPLITPGFVMMDWGVEGMSERERAAELVHILSEVFHLLFGPNGQQPMTTMILEDSQNLDEYGWELLSMLGGCTKALICAVSTVIPDGHPVVQSFDKARRSPHFWVVYVSGVTVDIIGRVIVQQLQKDGVAEASVCHEEVAEFIHERTQGNPLFASEWISRLHKNALLNITADGVVCFDHSATADYGENPRCPFGVQAAIISSVDRIASTQQLTLRVCAVFGRMFTAENIYEAFPSSARPAELSREGHMGIIRSDLMRLRKSGFIIPSASQLHVPLGKPANRIMQSLSDDAASGSLYRNGSGNFLHHGGSDSHYSGGGVADGTSMVVMASNSRLHQVPSFSGQASVMSTFGLTSAKLITQEDIELPEPMFSALNAPIAMGELDWSETFLAIRTKCGRVCARLGAVAAAAAAAAAATVLAVVPTTPVVNNSAGVGGSVKGLNQLRQELALIIEETSVGGSSPTISQARQRNADRLKNMIGMEQDQQQQQLQLQGGQPRNFFSPTTGGKIRPVFTAKQAFETRLREASALVQGTDSDGAAWEAWLGKVEAELLALSLDDEGMGEAQEHLFTRLTKIVRDAIAFNAALQVAVSSTNNNTAAGGGNNNNNSILFLMSPVPGNNSNTPAGGGGYFGAPNTAGSSGGGGGAASNSLALKNSLDCRDAQWVAVRSRALAMVSSDEDAEALSSACEVIACCDVRLVWLKLTKGVSFRAAQVRLAWARVWEVVRHAADSDTPTRSELWGRIQYALLQTASQARLPDTIMVAIERTVHNLGLEVNAVNADEECRDREWEDWLQRFGSTPLAKKELAAFPDLVPNMLKAAQDEMLRIESEIREHYETRLLEACEVMSAAGSEIQGALRGVSNDTCNSTIKCIKESIRLLSEEYATNSKTNESEGVNNNASSNNLNTTFGNNNTNPYNDAHVLYVADESTVESWEAALRALNEELDIASQACPEWGGMMKEMLSATILDVSPFAPARHDGDGEGGASSSTPSFASTKQAFGLGTTLRESRLEVIEKTARRIASMEGSPYRDDWPNHHTFCARLLFSVAEALGMIPWIDIWRRIVATMLASTEKTRFDIDEEEEDEEMNNSNNNRSSSNVDQDDDCDDIMVTMKEVVEEDGEDDDNDNDNEGEDKHRGGRESERISMKDEGRRGSPMKSRSPNSLHPGRISPSSPENNHNNNSSDEGSPMTRSRRRKARNDSTNSYASGSSSSTTTTGNIASSSSSSSSGNNNNIVSATDSSNYNNWMLTSFSRSGGEVAAPPSPATTVTSSPSTAAGTVTTATAALASGSVNSNLSIGATSLNSGNNSNTLPPPTSGSSNNNNISPGKSHPNIMISIPEGTSESMTTHPFIDIVNEAMVEIASVFLLSDPAENTTPCTETVGKDILRRMQVKVAELLRICELRRGIEQVLPMAQSLSKNQQSALKNGVMAFAGRVCSITHSFMSSPSDAISTPARSLMGTFADVGIDEHDPEIVNKSLPIIFRGVEDVIDSPDQAYMFNWPLLQDVVYNHVPFAQRQELHCNVAGMYRTAEEVAPGYHVPELVHHLTLSNDSKRSAELAEMHVEKISNYVTRSLEELFGNLSLRSSHWFAVIVKLVPWIRGLHVFHKEFSKAGPMAVAKNVLCVDATERFRKMIQDALIPKQRKKIPVPELDSFPLESITEERPEDISIEDMEEESAQEKALKDVQRRLAQARAQLREELEKEKIERDRMVTRIQARTRGACARMLAVLLRRKHASARVIQSWLQCAVARESYPDRKKQLKFELETIWVAKLQSRVRRLLDRKWMNYAKNVFWILHRNLARRRFFLLRRHTASCLIVQRAIRCHHARKELTIAMEKREEEIRRKQINFLNNRMKKQQSFVLDAAAAVGRTDSQSSLIPLPEVHATHVEEEDVETPKSKPDGEYDERSSSSRQLVRKGSMRKLSSRKSGRRPPRLSPFGDDSSTRSMQSSGVATPSRLTSPKRLGRGSSSELRRQASLTRPSGPPSTGKRHVTPRMSMTPPKKVSVVDIVAAAAAKENENEEERQKRAEAEAAKAKQGKRGGSDGGDDDDDDDDDDEERKKHGDVDHVGVEAAFDATQFDRIRAEDVDDILATLELIKNDSELARILRICADALCNDALVRFLSQPRVIHLLDRLMETRTEDAVWFFFRCSVRKCAHPLLLGSGIITILSELNLTDARVEFRRVLTLFNLTGLDQNSGPEGVPMLLATIESALDLGHTPDDPHCTLQMLLKCLRFLSQFYAGQLALMRHETLRVLNELLIRRLEPCLVLKVIVSLLCNDESRPLVFRNDELAQSIHLAIADLNSGDSGNNLENNNNKGLMKKGIGGLHRVGSCIQLLERIDTMAQESIIAPHQERRRSIVVLCTKGDARTATLLQETLEGAVEILTPSREDTWERIREMMTTSVAVCVVISPHTRNCLFTRCCCTINTHVCHTPFIHLEPTPNALGIGWVSTLPRRARCEFADDLPPWKLRKCKEMLLREVTSLVAKSLRPVSRTPSPISHLHLLPPVVALTPPKPIIIRPQRSAPAVVEVPPAPSKGLKHIWISRPESHWVNYDFAYFCGAQQAQFDELLAREEYKKCASLLEEFGLEMRMQNLGQHELRAAATQHAAFCNLFAIRALRRRPTPDVVTAHELLNKALDLTTLHPQIVLDPKGMRAWTCDSLSRYYFQAKMFSSTVKWASEAYKLELNPAARACWSLHTAAGLAALGRHVDSLETLQATFHILVQDHPRLRELTDAALLGNPLPPTTTRETSGPLRPGAKSPRGRRVQGELDAAGFHPSTPTSIAVACLTNIAIQLLRLSAATEAVYYSHAASQIADHIFLEVCDQAMMHQVLRVHERVAQAALHEQKRSLSRAASPKGRSSSSSSHRHSPYTPMKDDEGNGNGGGGGGAAAGAPTSNMSLSVKIPNEWDPTTSPPLLLVRKNDNLDSLVDVASMGGKA